MESRIRGSGVGTRGGETELHEGVEEDEEVRRRERKGESQGEGARRARGRGGVEKRGRIGRDSGKSQEQDLVGKNCDRGGRRNGGRSGMVEMGKLGRLEWQWGEGRGLVR